MIESERGQQNLAFEFSGDSLESLRAEQAETNLMWAKSVAEANIEIERLRYELKRFHEASAAGRDWEKLWAEREDEIERLREEGQQLRDEWQKALIDASVSRDRMQEALFDKAVAGGKIRVARSDALEEAAKVAEEWGISRGSLIAMEIRALKEKIDA